ncbi:MAG: tRNA (adenosine(37)-N6)-dimethylallyltransferase MiaA [Actinomycetes bacterium]
MTTPPVVAVVGPTATGKSDLALDLAAALATDGGPGEVVNADASQLYRGMDVGTAKLPPDQRRGVPHHQLDVLEVTQEASVAAYQRHARADLADVARRGRTPLLVGGSGLYVRAVLDELDLPGTDAGIRARLEAEAAERGAAAMHERLAAVDPAAATAILPGNVRRVVRALEVVELTGRPFTATLPSGEPAMPSVRIGLHLDRAALDERIARRVDAMWDAGLVAEVEGLVERGLRAGRTASRAVGYAQVLALLDGDLTEEQARDETVRATRRLARRQERWFRRDPRIVWLDVARPGVLDRALDVVASAAP